MTLFMAIKEFFAGIETGKQECKQPPQLNAARAPSDTKGEKSSRKNDLCTGHEPADTIMQLKLSDVRPCNMPAVNNDGAAGQRQLFLSTGDNYFFPVVQG
jgi:hypothetical protein